MKSLVPLLSTVLFIALTTPLFSQTNDWAWASDGGGTSLERATDVAVDASGNSYITGFFTSPLATFGTSTLTNTTTTNKEDFYLAKLDANGNFLWAVEANGPGHDHGSALALDPQGNIYVTGYYEDTIRFEDGTELPGSNWKALFVAKFDNSGTLQWAKSGIGNGHNVGNDIAVDDNGNVFVAGHFENMLIIDGTPYNAIAGLNGDGFVAQFNTSGSLQWVEQIGGTGSGGQSSLQNANSITVSPNGSDLFVAGWFRGYVTWGGVGGIIDTSSNFPTSGWRSLFVAKYSAAGAIDWVKAGHEYEINASSNSEVVGIGADGNGNVYMAGNVAGGLVFDGDTIEMMAPLNSWDYDGFIIKYDDQGTKKWIEQIGLDDDDQLRDIDVESNGDFTITGHYRGAVPVGTITLPMGTNAPMLAKFNTSGTVQWALGQPDAYLSVAYGVANAPDGEVVIAGEYTTQASFGDIDLTGIGLAAVFVAKTGMNIGIDKLNSSLDFSLYPNPANEFIQIDLEDRTSAGVLTIYSIDGRIMHQDKTNGLQAIDISDLTPGLYLLEVSLSDKTGITKLVVQ